MRSLRIVVSASRKFRDQVFVYNALDQLTERLDEVTILSGMCEDSADIWAVEWAKYRGWLWEEYPADWDNISAPGSVVRRRRDGTPYNLLAGHARNETMAQKGQALVAFHLNNSGGCGDMCKRAQAHGLPIRRYVFRVGQSGAVEFVSLQVT